MVERVTTHWTADTILELLHAHRGRLRAMGIQKIGLFGSYVRGQATPDSDIDLLFEMDHLTFARWMDAWNFLEDSFGQSVDLVPEKDLRAEIRASILAEVRYAEDV